MAIQLLITIDDLMQRTSWSGNIDTDKMLPHIENAQELEIMPLLGETTYDELLKKIEDTSIDKPANECWKTLWIDYVTPALVFFTAEYFLPFHQYTIANAGVDKPMGENYETVRKEEVDFLVQKYRNLADGHAKRMQKYMCKHPECFSAYCNAMDVVTKKSAEYRVGLFLGGC